ncbi:Fic family protein [Sedimentibacter hydroxybenzoicus DSM 7310]|uniref:protein adenylyltransferase n=1 Tax=Sedimentibacter hydroxybenzoicus DSM 7310 TaxID=1123245 RepID=A0A974BMK3_SEDHY|nr:Fic family protein [Sedimentibacter hydroxybenzoicus]NYB75335.1 Fic family protein [Sedimentibacter hydroxybenzoicus DSM 7310]
MSDQIYCYPNSGALINKLNIRDCDILSEAERKLTMLRISDLIDNPIKGEFDLKHLQTIHKYIFQDIYDWAGEIRTVDIAKQNMFLEILDYVMKRTGKVAVLSEYGDKPPYNCEPEYSINTSKAVQNLKYNV